MGLFDSLGKNQAFKYSMLATKVSQTIRKIERDGNLDDNEYDIIANGDKMLTQIIEGSLLVDRKDAIDSISPSQEGLFAYSHALSAIERLNLLSEDNDLTDLFLNYHKNMNALSKKNTIEKDYLEALKNFFRALSKLFSEDLQSEYYKAPKNMTLASIS
jgi:hypothetical protein